MASEATGVSGLALRYAVALFELAEEGGALDPVARDLRDLKAMLAASPDLTRLVRSPVLTRAEQAKVLDALASNAGFNPLVRNFLALVAKNRRLFAVPQMIDAYLARLAERRGEMTAEVTSAQPLTGEQLARLTDQLRRTAGRRVSLETRVDPSLLGGMVLKLGSQMIDGSLKNKLQRLQLAMKAAG